MLKVLRRIVSEVSKANDLLEALEIVVSGASDAISADSCAIYLFEPGTHDYLLMAAKGYKTDAVGKVRIRLHQGLVGLVGEREEPINLSDASVHPHYYFSPKTGEETFRAFLGVPIIHQRNTLGVLVVRREKASRFDEAEEAFLVTLSAQLASLIAHAEATGDFPTFLTAGGSNKVAQEKVIYGIPGAPGVALGTAVVVYPLADLEAVPERRIQDIHTEIAVFNEALAKARLEIKQLSERLSDQLPPEEHDIFEAFLHILDNASLGIEVIELIQQGHWAQGALKKVIQKHVRAYEDMDDEYLRERGSDIKDLGRRVLNHLQQQDHIPYSFPKDTILVGENVTPSRLAEVPAHCLKGIVSLSGSRNSHIAILARALGLPTVMGVDALSLSKIENKPIILDGYNGHLYLNPSDVLFSEFSRLAQEEDELYSSLKTLESLPSQTKEGHAIPLYVNTGLAADIPQGMEKLASGIGLYRSEIPFMMRDRFPSEEEQRLIYRQILQSFAPLPVTMRTLDVGGDKNLPYFPIEEANPFLGWRGIRITLDHPEIFLMQVRAMLRASDGLNNLRILLPMVSSVSEVKEAIYLIEQAYEEVTEDIDIKKPEIGVMIEVPSAVFQAQAIANLVDFLSVGTNDLIQYLLAVDRNNTRVASLYDALHPAVLRALQDVVTSAHNENKKVGVCGEMASDPLSVILLIAMGYDNLSVTAKYLLSVKWVIRSFSRKESHVIFDEVLKMSDSLSIRNYLRNVLEEAGLGGLIRAGK